jgi:hypothetical protein
VIEPGRPDFQFMRFHQSPSQMCPTCPDVTYFTLV